MTDERDTDEEFDRRLKRIRKKLAGEIYAMIRGELKKIHPKDRPLVKQELLCMLDPSPQRKRAVVHRYDKPVFRVINGGRP